MRGRKPNPAGLKAVESSAPKKRSKRTRVIRPGHLGGEARREWDRVRKEMEGRGILTALDRGILARYCLAWQRWVEAEAQLDATGGPVVETAKGNLTYNPWWAASSRAQEQMQKAAVELGLTPVSRCRVRLPEKKGAGALQTKLHAAANRRRAGK